MYLHLVSQTLSSCPVLLIFFSLESGDEVIDAEESDIRLREGG
jgi:hypothetical protein